MSEMLVGAGTLLPGDIVIHTGETVLQRSAGVGTPSGKTDVVLQKGERRRIATWRKSTMIKIERKTQ